MRCAVFAEAAAVNQAVAAQRRVYRSAVERVVEFAVDWQLGEGLVLDGFPEALAFLEPVADVARRKLVLKRVTLFPAIILAHLQQVDAQRVIAGMTRVGNMAIALNRVQQGPQVLLHQSRK